MVSGTNLQQKRKEKTQIPENNQKTPAGEPNRCSKAALSMGKNWLPRKKASQSATPATDMAFPRIRVGKISDIINQTNGARLLTKAPTHKNITITTKYPDQPN